MPVNEVTARYLRRVQAGQYEPAEAEVTVRAQVLEGEDGNSVVGRAMAQAKTAVLASLGLVKAAEKPQEPVEAKLQDQGDTPAPAVTEVKRGPGRPSKAKAEDKPVADPASMDDFETAPAKAEQTKPAAKEISEKELQDSASAAAQRLGGPEKVKALMSRDYRITRLGELEPARRAAFVADLEKLQK